MSWRVFWSGESELEHYDTLRVSEFAPGEFAKFLTYGKCTRTPGGIYSREDL